MTYDEIVFANLSSSLQLEEWNLRKVLRVGFQAHIQKTITFQPQKSFF